jgi:coproporphyrinogen III oxidase-like Fe-S oxidoreductase
VLTDAGFHWYEVSNWARDESARCAHNLLYWRNQHWWGVGPGAHGHVGGTRWWNVRNPATYADLVAAGTQPVEGCERAGADQRALEDLLLGIRLVEGIAVDDVAAREPFPRLVDDGLIDSAALARGRLTLTRRGRLLTDSVIRALMPDGPRG